MRVTVLVVLAMALAACAPGPRATPDVRYYDLGPLAKAPEHGSFAGLRSVEVFAPSWLDSAALQYRQTQLNSQRRQNFAESRWVAPPAELVAQALRRTLLAGAARGGCKLRVDLDEFVQVFDATASSRALIEARVQLVSPGAAELLARQAFIVERLAAGADAAGGVQALSAATERLAALIGEWLAGLERSPAQGSGIAARCSA